MASNVPLLEYASRHTQVHREHERTVITVPPDASWGSWLQFVLLCALGLLCLAGTFWPGVISLQARLAPLLFAVICLAGARASWRVRRGITTLTVRGRTLTLITPGLIDMRETTYDLNEWVDADVQCGDDDSPWLWLHGKDGRAMARLLHTQSFEESELELAAAALREEMNRLQR